MSDRVEYRGYVIELDRIVDMWRVATNDWQDKTIGYWENYHEARVSVDKLKEGEKDD